MENKPTPHHNVYHPHPTHPANLNLNYDPTKVNFDSHDQFSDSHDYTNVEQTNIEQFNYDYDMYPTAPMAQPQMPYHAPAPYPGMVCPTNCLPEKYDPPMYDPAQQNLTNAVQNVVIPHVHPSHTTHNIHTHYVNQHYFPHSESCCYSASCEDVVCGPLPPCPCPNPMPAHHGW